MSSRKPNAATGRGRAKQPPSGMAKGKDKAPTKENPQERKQRYVQDYLLFTLETTN